MVEEAKCIYFRGKQHPFSNFYPSSIIIDDKQFPTVEHYFQSQKFVGSPHEISIMKAQTPGQAKKLGKSRTYKIRSDWEEVKVNIMEKGVKAKFSQNSKILEKLIETENNQLVENALCDYYWGCGKTKKGKNMLGKILMKVRDEFRKIQFQ